MNSRTRILVIALLFRCFDAHSGPAVVLVDIDPDNAGPSLDQAIAVANSGTPTVARFGSGTFVFDNAPVNGGFTQIDLAGNLTLLGDGAMLTGNGPSGGRLISVVIGGYLSVDGLNFRNFGAPITGGGFGGVINLEGGGLHVNHSVFQRNFAAMDGGAISIFNSTEDSLIENSSFIDNRAAINGGAIDFENQMNGGDVRFRLVNTTFEVNKAIVSGCAFDVLDARAPASPDRIQLHNVTVVDGDCTKTT